MNDQSTGRLVVGSFSDLDRQLDESIAWLTSLGVRLAATRLQHYRDQIDLLLDVYERQDEETATTNLDEFVNTLLEVHDLVEISRGFSSSDHRDFLHPRILEISSGPDRYTKENRSSGNRPRNTAFELMVASRLAGAGLPLVRHQLADIGTKVNGKLVLFECKRPQSENAVGRRIRQGFSQLKRRYKRSVSNRVRGIVAIDLTKAFNPEFKSMPFDDPSHIGPWMTNLIETYANQYSEIISSSGQRKTIAVVFRLSLMAIPTREAENIAYCQQWGINTFESSRESDKRIALQIGRAIEDSSPHVLTPV